MRVGILAIIRKVTSKIIRTFRRFNLLSLRWLLIILLLYSLQLSAQVLSTFKLKDVASSPLPKSNSINDIIISKDSIWVGMGRGLSLTLDNGKSWKHFSNTLTFDEKGSSALAVRGNEIWAATAYSVKSDNENIPTGHGLHYSADNGNTWHFISQPVDTGTVDTLVYGNNKIRALAVPIPQGNVTFDIALTNNAVWIASWYGMLRKSTDKGKTWRRVILPPDARQEIKPTDTLDFDLSPSAGKLGLRENLNHLVFTVYASNDSTIWVGTAGGINKSTDGGVSWRKFTHQNQNKPISGNYIAGIKEQRWKSKTIIWAVSNTAVDPDEKRGVSFSEDGGESWNTITFSDFMRDVTFKDSIVYIASDGGLYRTDDFGKTIVRAGAMYDHINLQRFTENKINAVAVKGDTVWVGGSEGIAYTIDTPTEPFGTRWRIFRTYQPVEHTAKTYSYPLPFSPDDEPVRIHYGTQGKTASVTIRIFDFAMQPVRTLIQNVQRSGGYEHDELWNGTDDFNRRVANGVYFYRVEIEGNDPQWGKIFVLQ